ncbi:soluble NSF attachment protein 29-like [Halichondria panicea]|uniref:soluble NSF attachment protein 29-like n=1 Tax=Halichondria panicea TaxID=6063 RepID=UPI00312B74C3
MVHGEMAGRNPFGDDNDDGGFGSSSQRSSGYSNSRGDQGPAQGNEPLDYQTREQMAIRRMEESSANSLRSLNETYRMGIDTTQELELQAEKLDNVERKLDEIHVDLDKSKRNLRLIKSPFGGIANYFSKRKEGKEVTDPKDYKPPPNPSNPTRSKPKTSAAKMDQLESTGSKVVDGNLDEMSKQLDRLMGVGELIGVQLDDSEIQVDRLKYKIDRDRDKMEHINRDIKKRI